MTDNLFKTRPMNFQKHIEKANAFEEKSQYKDAYAIYAWILNDIVVTLIENSKEWEMNQSSHENLIFIINDCSLKLQSLYSKCIRKTPPPIPPKPKKLNERFRTDSISSEISKLEDKTIVADESTMSSMSLTFENDQLPSEKDLYTPPVPKSELINMYTKLVEKDVNFNPDKDLFGGFSSRGELLQKIMDYIHVSTTLTEINHIRPFYLAFQLCLIDQELFRRIVPSDFFNTNQSKSSIEPSTHFFNYLCRAVEHTSLNPTTPNARAEILEYWIKTSKRLYQLRNFQSLKAITSALQSPPLYRLKNTWALVSKKKIKDLNALLEFCSEQDNYSHYRQWMKLNISKPMIPYFGIYIHDLTYISAMDNKTFTPRKTSMEILDQIRYFQAEPFYSYKYFTSLLTGSIYPKPRKPPIAATAPAALLALNSYNEESVGLFVSHYILSQKFYPEKVIDELSLIREPRDIIGLNYLKRNSLDIAADSGKLLHSFGSYRKNIMNSIKTTMGRGRTKNEKLEKSWSSLQDIGNIEHKTSGTKSIQ